MIIFIMITKISDHVLQSGVMFLISSFICNSKVFLFHDIAVIEQYRTSCFVPGLLICLMFSRD